MSIRILREPLRHSESQRATKRLCVLGLTGPQLRRVSSRYHRARRPENFDGELEGIWIALHELTEPEMMKAPACFRTEANGATVRRWKEDVLLCPRLRRFELRCQNCGSALTTLFNWGNTVPFSKINAVRSSHDTAFVKQSTGS